MVLKGRKKIKGTSDVDKEKKTISKSKKRNKKSIAPVVAEALLIVVAVVAVIGFSKWFSSYESSTLANTEQTSTFSNNFQIDALINNILYLRSSTNTNLTMLEVVDSKGNILCKFSVPTNISNKGLVGWWTFDKIINNSGTLEVPDLSGHGNVGILKNGFRVNVTYINGTNIIIKPFYYNNSLSTSNANPDSFNDKLLDIKNCYINGDKILNTSWIGITILNLTLNDSSNLQLNHSYNISCRNLPQLVKTPHSHGLKFNGKDEYVSISNLLFDYYKSLYHLSVCAIVKTNNQKYNIIVSFDRSEYFRLAVGDDTIPQTHYVNFDTDYNNSVKDYDMKGNHKLDKNIYYLICGIYNNNTGKYIYVNNILDAYNSTYKGFGLGDGIPRTGFIGVGSEDAYFKDCIGPLNFFKGIIDEVRIYNRSLTPEEVKKLYWYSIRPLEKGVNEIDLSSCNLTKGNTYEVVAFDTNGDEVDKTLIAK